MSATPEHIDPTTVVSGQVLLSVDGLVVVMSGQTPIFGPWSLVVSLQRRAPQAYEVPSRLGQSKAWLGHYDSIGDDIGVGQNTLTSRVSLCVCVCVFDEMAILL